MCSIFGIGFFKDHNLAKESTITGVISRMFREAEIGGRLAAGLSIMREHTNHVLRRPLSGSQLVATEEYLGFMGDSLESPADKSNRLMSIIGHCRYPTQGHESINENNHPQVIDNIIGVHNGHINNDYELFDSFSKVITRKAQVDTEIIFQLIKHFNKGTKSKTVDAICKATPYLSGGYACGMQNTRHPYNLYLFRHGNPIKVLYYAKLGLVFFATREHFIKKSFEEFVDKAYGKGTPIDLLDNQGMAFNLWDRSINKFRFRDKKQAEELNGHA